MKSELIMFPARLRSGIISDSLIRNSSHSLAIEASEKGKVLQTIR